MHDTIMRVEQENLPLGALAPRERATLAKSMVLCNTVKKNNLWQTAFDVVKFPSPPYTAMFRKYMNFNLKN